MCFRVSHPPANWGQKLQTICGLCCLTRARPLCPVDLSRGPLCLPQYLSKLSASPPHQYISYSRFVLAFVRHLFRLGVSSPFLVPVCDASPVTGGRAECNVSRAFSDVTGSLIPFLWSLTLVDRDPRRRVCVAQRLCTVIRGRPSSSSLDLLPQTVHSRFLPILIHCVLQNYRRLASGNDFPLSLPEEHYG